MKKKYIRLPDGQIVERKFVSSAMLRDQELIEKMQERLAKFQKAEREYEESLKKYVFPRLAEINEGRTKDEQRKGITISSSDNMFQIKVTQNDLLFLDDRAEIAKNLIDKYLEDLRGKISELTPDMQNMITLLEGVLSGDRKKIRITPTLLQFVGYRFEDDRLLKAQEYLKAALQVKMSKIYVNFYRRNKTTNELERWDALKGPQPSDEIVLQDKGKKVG